jgi:hypothetical protein
LRSLQEQPVADRELPVSFSSFIVSLAASAMHHLGEAPDPVTRQKSVDLVLARNTIDLLGMLKEKTANNLDEEEAKLLETLLFELRSKYLEAAKSEAPTNG